MANLRLEIDGKRREEEMLRRKQDGKEREEKKRQKRSAVKLMRQLEFLRQKGWTCKCRKTMRGTRAGQTEVIFVDSNQNQETECLKIALRRASSPTSKVVEQEEKVEVEPVSVAVRVPENFKTNKASQYVLIRYMNRDALVPLPAHSGLVPGSMIMVRLRAEHFEFKTKGSHKKTTSVAKKTSPPELSSKHLKGIPKLEQRKNQRETLYALNLDARLDWRVGQFRLDTQDASWRLVGFPVLGFDPEAETEALLREERLKAEKEQLRIEEEQKQEAKMRPLLDRLDNVGWTITKFADELSLHPNYVRWYV